MVLSIILSGIILFTFLNVDSTPAIITSVMIGLGIVFCGAAVVHNVLVWQRVSERDLIARFLPSYVVCGLMFCAIRNDYFTVKETYFVVSFKPNKIDLFYYYLHLS